MHLYGAGRAMLPDAGEHMAWRWEPARYRVIIGLFQRPVGQWLQQMNVIHSTDGFLQQHPGCVATIGKFDGVHRGHQQIVRQLIEKSKEYGLPSVVIVIEPHPEEFFASRPQDCPPRLSEASEKVALLQALGVDTVFLLPFDLPLSRLSPKAYIEDILVSGLNIRCLIVGGDFRFGHRRAGDYSLLVEQGRRFGFEVQETASCELDGVRISSTYVRELLAAGDFEQVRAALGRPYAMTGHVVKGRQLGRNLGFPTCNLALNRRNIPLHGVYACEVIIQMPAQALSEQGSESAGKQCAATIEAYGAANIGYRPTVTDQGAALLEVHLLDFQGDIYGARVTVIFRKKIRPEHKFDTLEALTDRIRQDVEEVRQHFAATVI